jgi:HTH-type transcriptional regulator/antitoxin HigA
LTCDKSSTPINKNMETLFHAKPNTKEGDILELLALVIEDYEDKNYKIGSLSPLEAPKCEMEEQGLSQASLTQRIGMSKSTISEILQGKKQMSVRFMKYHHNDLGILGNVLLAS